MNPAKMSDLTSHSITNTELILVSTHKSPVLEESINKGYVAVDWGTAFEINYSQTFNDVSPPVLHTTLARIALEFILDHNGSAYLPFRMVEHLLDKHLFQVKDAPVFTRPIFACSHSESRISSTIEQVVEIVNEISNTSNL